MLVKVSTINPRIYLLQCYLPCMSFIHFLDVICMHHTSRHSTSVSLCLTGVSTPVLDFRRPIRVFLMTTKISQCESWLCSDNVSTNQVILWSSPVISVCVIISFRHMWRVREIFRCRFDLSLFGHPNETELVETTVCIHIDYGVQNLNV